MPTPNRNIIGDRKRHVTDNRHLREVAEAGAAMAFSTSANRVNLSMLIASNHAHPPIKTLTARLPEQEQQTTGGFG